MSTPKGQAGLLLSFACLLTSACTPHTEVGAVQQPSPGKAAVAAQTQPVTSALEITSALGLNGAPVSAALRQPFDGPYQITLDNAAHTPQTLGNCADFLKAEGHIYSAGSDLDYHALLKEGARCDALELLSHARPASNGSFANFSFAALKTSDLPPQVDLLIANESVSKASGVAARGGSVLTIEPSLRMRNKGPYESDLGAKDWTGTLTDYGHADLYGDGGDELLLLRTAQAKEGTYAATDLFVLKRDGNHPLSVVDQRPHLTPPAAPSH